eukprot:CAMPEP_0195069598 /NCGR_PEP_ID=MMETSP0448-20130528/13875_1 /TAXON_ID=66468 /ORGANISM="Heterocapsa triquestra, Strain CCMP 448" /LENGTH=67 /DNA_ID=CAMNT_0040101221 /DNA_START=72 /DNA_END=272 /DNA_ORIENTATION=-
MAVTARSAMAAATKMDPAVGTYCSAFNAIGHLLNACASGMPPQPVWEVDATEVFESMLAWKWADIPP